MFVPVLVLVFVPLVELVPVVVFALVPFVELEPVVVLALVPFPEVELFVKLVLLMEAGTIRELKLNPGHTGGLHPQER